MWVCVCKDAHSQRHLRLRRRSSEERPPRRPSEVAPTRRRHGNREPASPCWGASSYWRSKGTLSWGGGGPETEADVDQNDMLTIMSTVKSRWQDVPVVSSRDHVLLVDELDAIYWTPAKKKKPKKNSCENLKVDVRVFINVRNFNSAREPELHSICNLDLNRYKPSIPCHLDVQNETQNNFVLTHWRHRAIYANTHSWPWKTSCDSSAIFHTLTERSRPPAVTQRSRLRLSSAVMASWWPKLWEVIMVGKCILFERKPFHSHCDNQNQQVLLHFVVFTVS